MLPTAPPRYPSTAPEFSLSASERAIIDILNGLIETCADGAYGFSSCADYSNISRHRALFRQQAQQCREAVEQLHAQVLRLGGTPSRGGSASGALHRGWVAVRGTLSGLRDQSILAECDRGETVALERYQLALEQTLTTEARVMVQRQMEGLRTNLGQIRILRQTTLGAA